MFIELVMRSNHLILCHLTSNFFVTSKPCLWILRLLGCNTLPLFSPCSLYLMVWDSSSLKFVAQALVLVRIQKYYLRKSSMTPVGKSLGTDDSLLSSLFWETANQTMRPVYRDPTYCPSPVLSGPWGDSEDRGLCKPPEYGKQQN